MSRRFFASIGVVALLLPAIWLSPVSLTAQSPASTKPRPASKPWTVGRTPDGQPDLQGYWTNTTYVPLERPKDVNKEFYTREEVVELMKHAAADEAEQTVPGTVADVHYDFTQFGLDRSQSPVAVNLRTSLIVNPENGRLPQLSPEGQRRAAERAEARKLAGGQFDAAQNQPLSVRCIIMDRVGPPMLAGAYNNNYQIVQTRDYVMILVEMLHDVRLVPLDGRPALDGQIRSWKGSSRGHWDGDTLVIETTNFNGKVGITRNGNTLPTSPELRIVERITRVDAVTLQYQATVSDPRTWTRPWTVALPLKSHPEYGMFEYACHEGNYAMKHILSGARADEKP